MCFEFQGYMLHAEYKTKYPLIYLLEYLLNSFYMFGIWIWNEKNDEPDAIGIKCKNFNRDIGYTIQNIPFKNLVTAFVANIVFKNFGLVYIFENIKNLNFDVQELCISWLGDGPW